MSVCFLTHYLMVNIDCMVNLWIVAAFSNSSFSGKTSLYVKTFVYLNCTEFCFALFCY